ncbi:MAG: single-stranded-DNA-specific exonuclease RecJ [Anaerolineae bacterium]|nr:MAG: single-stranded-DNA-specific exonuclease RecJ [Anaerolineae bacterium]
MSRPETISPKRWRLSPPPPQDVLNKLAGYGPDLAHILYNRGIQGVVQADEFLAHRYSRNRDPYLLTDIDRAVARIQKAVERDEKVVVYGDFDADGVTSTVLMTQALRQLGFARSQVLPYIPDRVDEGYGLNIEALTQLREKGVNLVICVDCGIRSIREVDHANEIGLDLIISDHHNLGGKLPPAAAIINPKRPESQYPEKELAGVGVAYKLVQALGSSLPGQTDFNDKQFLDLVAIGTVADMVPLVGENRVLVADGLDALRTSQRPGIDALARVAGIQRSNITAESIAFALAPRINAAGRMAHAYDAARLLAANNRGKADEYAQNLDALNRQRQKITRELAQLAESLIDPGDPLLFIDDPGFHSGVVGLVASQLADKYYRPTIVVERGDSESRGSCRSIPEFHITRALDQLAELLIRHGGHAMAAGFTVANEKLDEFRRQMINIAAAELDPLELYPTIGIDTELSLSDIDWALHDQLNKLEPTGASNQLPILMSRKVMVNEYRAVGRDGSHLQLWVSDDRVKFKCIAFRQGDWAGNLPDQVDLAYTINKDDWNGRNALQLVIKDIREPLEEQSSLGVDQ